MATNYTPSGAPMKKKTNPLVWIFVGLAAFFVLLGLLVVAGGFFAFYKAKQAGLDPDLFKKNPALAAVNLALTNNPDVEKLSIDEGKGTITVRDKKTGKVVTMSFEDIKSGKFSFQEEGKEKVTMEAKGDGETGSLTVKSSEGEMKLGAGAGANMPDWLPAYPGAKVQGNFSAQGKEGEAGNFVLTTKDSIEQVANFYEAALKKVGFQVGVVTDTRDGKKTGALVAGEADGGKRTANVTVSSDNEGTHAAIEFKIDKK